MNEKLNITLPAEELVEVINNRVDAGLYASSSDVLEAAMKLFLADEREHEEAVASVRARIKASLDDPRPNISDEDMDQWIEGLAVKYR
ncbi:type II toxin-antitoxin system ParD family antitoxin [Pararhizobium sp. YC-54]|uniref:ribbon-helix-helix domain-containing protein n=1 Tax=Pararhizobium sp. YC-54 TaxID=2986920 RepID=UPI0021F6F9C3|nr:type II toxin-antitoxin system ParD family antitoxin [Pararhizobium sp. YC-54]MCV9997790.1 type II toxin-antitoxin system ParD family antitoxin [Pararhizobium sp. YC-54]